MFTENQVRQFYVTNSNAVAPSGANPTNASSAGAMKLVVKGDEAYFLYKGPSEDGIQRTDLIKKCNIMDIRCTDAADLVHKNKKAVLTLDPSLITSSKVNVSENFVLNVDIHNFLAPDYNTTKNKFGAVRTVGGTTTVSDFYKKMAISLAKNFAREAAPLVKIFVNTAATGATATNTEVTASTDISSISGTIAAIVIEEVAQPWRRGAAPVEYVNFTVEPGTVYASGADIVWGKVQFAGSAKYTDGTASSVTVAAGGTQPNSKKVADMEWFFHKERGDRYGEMCWPWNIDTVYQVDPANVDGYSFVDIHFYFEGNCHNVGHSEKTLTVVGPKANLKTLIGGAASGNDAATGLYAFIEGTGVEIKTSTSW